MFYFILNWTIHLIYIYTNNFQLLHNVNENVLYVLQRFLPPFSLGTHPNLALLQSTALWPLSNSPATLQPCLHLSLSIFFFFSCTCLCLLCCHPEEVTKTLGAVQHRVTEWMQASLSPSLSSSSRWGEPNSSFVCPHQASWQSQTHLLFTLLINYTQAKGALRGKSCKAPPLCVSLQTAVKKPLAQLPPLISVLLSLWEQESVFKSSTTATSWG